MSKHFCKIEEVFWNFVSNVMLENANNILMETQLMSTVHHQCLHPTQLIRSTACDSQNNIYDRWRVLAGVQDLHHHMVSVADQSG